MARMPAQAFVRGDAQARVQQFMCAASTHDEAVDGMNEAEAVAQFLDYLREQPSSGHDIEALNCACERHFSGRARRSFHSIRWT